MTGKRFSVKLFFILLFFVVCTVPAGARAQGVSGTSYTVYIYSDMVEESSATMSFETNGTLLLDIYDGFGLYMDIGSLFSGTFSAPNFNATQDLLLLMTGVVTADYLSGMGLIFIDYQYTEFFLFFGYAH